MPARSKNGETVSVREATHDGTLGRLLHFVVDGRAGIITLIVICIVLTAVGNVASGLYLSEMINNVITPATTEYVFDGTNLVLRGLDGALLNKLIEYTCIVGAIFVVAVSASICYTQLVAINAQKIMKGIRADLFNKMESLPIKFFDTNSHGDIMSYYTNDVDAMYQFLGQSLVQFISIGCMLLFCVCLMLWFSIWLFLIACVGIVVEIFVSMYLTRLNRKYYAAQQKATAHMEGFVEEMMTGLKVVKVFTHEERAVQDFDKKNEELYYHGKKAATIGNIMMPIMNNIGNLMYVIIASIAIIFLIFEVPNVCLQDIAIAWNGGSLQPISLGGVVGFLTYTRQLYTNYGNLSNQLSQSARALAGARRILNVLDLQPETDNGQITLVNANFDENGNIYECEEKTDIWAWKEPHEDGTYTYTQLKGDIVLDNVDFGYNEDKIVLHNIDIYAHPGQKIAFVGATGAGKTTITNLINRFYDIQDGKVRYDGHSINEIKKSDLRRSLAMVLQDTNLFTGTVRENIRYGRLDATDEEVEEAAKIANAYDFITRLPQGFDTMLTKDGGNLSQGQRQLLSIARAACADAPVIILDEATSSIDTRTEQIVQKGIDQLMAGRTVFVIAHRLSTVQNADAIMVLDHGRIIERGNHQQLIEKKGTYYQLYTGAFELE
ncbi:MAG: ABC transporter ATP-binding protein/permease [Coprobacillus sp.]|nr:ABC transporter ATP-binding protein/permease [Coprobacillus sp.]